MFSSARSKLARLLNAGLPRSFPVCFIVSTGRTGTNFFESFFDEAVEGVHCLHEPWPDLFDLGVGLHRGQIPEARVVKKLRSSRLPMLLEAKKRGRGLYVESNPNASLLLPQIKKAFPDYRLIWITRDIHSYLPSAFNKSPDDSGKIFFYADDDHRKRLGADDIPSDPWNAEWKHFARAERIAWWWQKCNSLLIEHTKDDKRCMRFRFEDLFKPGSGPREIERLVDFLGIDRRRLRREELVSKALSEPKNQTRHSAASRQDGASPTESPRIDELSAKVRAALGYSA